ncbi:hypothetical protein BD626DRAFT_607920 [Schizophyllum amplum]|uniref:Uncharacterized protein n=1 Tax=Schizophyllum amplum TaxID=97359 RepID=A0A550C3L1_9AGAR|nr:hypothetical protein BD626DRAFT_607920 [Auriculariopsis ampla]
MRAHQPAARLLVAARAYSQQTPSPYATTGSTNSSKGWAAVRIIADDYGQSLQDKGTGRKRATPEEAWAAMSKSVVPELERQQPAGKYKVNRDLADAFRNLQQILSRNKVSKTYRYQLRHERKGDKRRRLRSENGVRRSRTRSANA